MEVLDVLACAEIAPFQCFSKMHKCKFLWHKMQVLLQRLGLRAFSVLLFDFRGVQFGDIDGTAMLFFDEGLDCRHQGEYSRKLGVKRHCAKPTDRAQIGMFRQENTLRRRW